MSLTSVAPAATAASATARFTVSTDTRTWRDRASIDRHHPAQLLALGHRLGPGSARLAPHVHDVGALAGHVEAVGHGPLRVEIATAVGERVRCDVEHTHDPRPHARRLEVPSGARNRQTARRSTAVLSGRGRTAWPRPGSGGRLGTGRARPR